MFGGAICEEKYPGAQGAVIADKIEKLEAIIKHLRDENDRLSNRIFSLKNRMGTLCEVIKILSVDEA